MKAEQTDAALVHAAKRRLRREMVSWRKSIPARIREEWSHAIVKKALTSAAYAKANTIFAYASMPGEVEFDALLKAILAAQKNLVIPDLTAADGEMRAVRLHHFGDLVIGRFDIRSLPPEKLEVVPPENIDLVFVPGAAFSPDGSRLGLGGGYYDRFLAKTSALCVACTFDGQVVDAVPMEPFDQYVDFILTENQTIDCRKVRKEGALHGD